MKRRLILVLALLAAIASFCYSQTVTVAFTNISWLSVGSKVVSHGGPIGNVSAIRGNKALDTLFVEIKVNKGVGIPVGSVFYLDENLLSSSLITVEYSTEKHMLTAKDISYGIFRPSKSMLPSQIDSMKMELKKVKAIGIIETKNQ